ncbi:aldehyde dehydrogenase [Pseudonocardia xishanensis]|uniref:Aldehyde dehydrogenase n=2 Tax=Pseudonocardia xishanensis TaxID=630995 RepID=A0ABP8RSC3_9PSEU
MLIDGELVPSSSGRVFDNLNPATEEIIGEVADGTLADADLAIAAARRAFDTTDWSTNHELRARALLQLQDALESERDLFRQELIDETGMPRSLVGSAHLDATLEDGLRYPVGLIRDFAWERELAPVDKAGRAVARRVRKEAVGVVGAIVPWNVPLEVTLHKLGQALATGNTVVLKPAPDTPFNATRLARLVAHKTDIPAGVLNVVTSSDHLIGEALVTDPRVDMISFTGSTATGRRIAEKAAPTLKRLFLELGGKSAHILLDDADLDVQVPLAARWVTAHAGQGCHLPTRLLAPRTRYDEIVARVAAEMEQIPYGDPNDPEVHMGPVISTRQHERVLGYLRIGQDEGARLVTGGRRPAHLDKGYFIEPTVFADVDNAMRIAQEEIFGPVLAVIPYDDEDDAVRIANDSPYGLAGNISSTDPERALRVANRLRVGVARINSADPYAADAPFGGYKQSGLGRQNGIEGFEQYLQTKTLGLPGDVR